MSVSLKKNDKVDSQKIGLYAYKNREDVKLWTPKRKIIIQLDHLIALREHLVKTIKTLKKTFSDTEGLVDKKTLKSEIALCQSSINALKKDLYAIDEKIRELIDTDQKFDIVDSVKAIGQVITTEILITTKRI